MNNLSQLLADGRWLAQRYDPVGDLVHFRFVDRELHRSAAFLKDPELGDVPVAIHPRADVMASAQSLSRPPVHFIFHSAYCCSTLLARAFDIEGTSMGMSEPSILTDVIQLRLDGGDARQVAAALDCALTLLARPLAAGEVNVIKPSNVVNPLVRAILAMRPESRAVFLYAPLETLVASIADKEIEGRAWARQLMWKLIRSGEAARFALSEEDLYRQTDLETAAMGWLTQHAAFAELASERLRTIDSDTLLARPAEALGAIGRLFGLKLDPEAVASGPAFQRHSKGGDRYDATRRADDKAQRLATHRREIDMVSEWARRLADFAEVPRTLPRPLIPDANRAAL